MDTEQLKRILEALIMASSTPLSLERMLAVFPEDQQPESTVLRESLTALAEDYAKSSLELKEVSSGFRFQVRKDYAEWVSKLWEEKPARYSRALLETLALVAYKQPVTRGEIEKIRGVSVNTQIMKTLLEREWVSIVGHRDVPGKPAIYATTRQFLDYFNLKSLEELPPLAEIRDLDQINGELDFPENEAEVSEFDDDKETVVSLDVQSDAEVAEAMRAEH
jgi:segregation and condensation protein B